MAIQVNVSNTEAGRRKMSRQAIRAAQGAINDLQVIVDNGDSLTAAQTRAAVIKLAQHQQHIIRLLARLV